MTSVNTQADYEEWRERRLRQYVVISDAVESIANQLTTDEGNEADTEEEFGLPASEIIGMAHDNMIRQAREAVNRANRIARGEV